MVVQGLVWWTELLHVVFAHLERPSRPDSLTALLVPKPESGWRWHHRMTHFTLLPLTSRFWVVHLHCKQCHKPDHQSLCWYLRCYTRNGRVLLHHIVPYYRTIVYLAVGSSVPYCAQLVKSSKPSLNHLMLALVLHDTEHTQLLLWPSMASHPFVGGQVLHSLYSVPFIWLQPTEIY